MTRFVKYIKTRKSITKQIITFMTRIPEESLQDETQKRYCYYSTQFLSNDDDALMDIYFENETEEQVEEDIQELEIEKLLTNEQVKITDGNDKPGQYQILLYFMNYLVEKDLQNQAYNGYFVKAVNIIIRKRGHDFLKFLQTHREFVDALLKGIRSPSIGTLLVKILIIDDEKKEFKYEGLKRQIVQNISEILLNNLQNNQLCESINSLIEDAFQTIKNKFFEYPEDFVRCLNYFVSQQYTNKLIDKFFSGSPTEIENAASFLLILIKKMNTEIEDFISNQRDRRESNSKKIQDSDFILKFELQNMFNQFEKLLLITQTEKFQQANTYTKHKIFDFFLELTKNERLFQTTLNYEGIIMLLIKQLNAKSTGIFKTEIYNLIKMFIQKSNTDLFNIPNGNQNIISQSFFKKYFPNLLDRETDLHKINSNALIGIETNILILLQTRNKNLFQTALEVLDINILEIKNRYEKMLGGEHKKNRGFVFQDDDQPIKFQKADEKKQPESIVVGKNKNIALPNLRYMTQSKKSRIQVKTLSESIQESKIPVKEIIEEQEIISHPIEIIQKKQTKLIDANLQEENYDLNQNEQKKVIVDDDTDLIFAQRDLTQDISERILKIGTNVEEINNNINHQPTQKQQQKVPECNKDSIPNQTIVLEQKQTKNANDIITQNVERQETTVTVVSNTISTENIKISAQKAEKQSQSQNPHQQVTQQTVAKQKVVPFKRSLSTQISKQAIRFYNKTFELIQ